MKKIKLLFTLMSFCFFSMAQVEEIKERPDWTTIGELKWMGTTKAQLAYTAQGKDTSYWLYLKDETILKSSNGRSVTKHFSIRFNNSGNALEHLKSMLFSFFEKENLKNKEYDKTFHLGGTTVVVQHYRKLTGTNIMFYTKEGYTLFNKRELTKLFGKAGD